MALPSTGCPMDLLVAGRCSACLKLFYHHQFVWQYGRLSLTLHSCATSAFRRCTFQAANHVSCSPRHYPVLGPGLSPPPSLQDQFSQISMGCPDAFMVDSHRWWCIFWFPPPEALFYCRCLNTCSPSLVGFLLLMPQKLVLRGILPTSLVLLLNLSLCHIKDW